MTKNNFSILFAALLTCASSHAQNVVEVSKLLGHSKVETTMEYITTDSSSLKGNHKNCVI